MEKTISAFEARRKFGKLLQGVAANGDIVVVERHGERVAAVVPIEDYERLQRSRKEFLDKIRATAERANMSPEEADELAAEAVRWARSNKSA
jgi:prevent-host-death family protein